MDAQPILPIQGAASVAFLARAERVMTEGRAATKRALGQLEAESVDQARRPAPAPASKSLDAAHLRVEVAL